MNLTTTEKALAQAAIDEEFKAQIAAVYRVRCQPPEGTVLSAIEIAREERANLLAELGVTARSVEAHAERVPPAS